MKKSRVPLPHLAAVLTLIIEQRSNEYMLANSTSNVPRKKYCPTTVGLQTLILIRDAIRDSLPAPTDPKMKKEGEE